MGVNILRIKTPYVEGIEHITPKDITSRSDLEKYSMDKISRISRLYKNKPLTTKPLVQRLSYNVMTEWGDNVLLRK